MIDKFISYLEDEIMKMDSKLTKEEKDEIREMTRGKAKILRFICYTTMLQIFKTLE